MSQQKLDLRRSVSIVRRRKRLFGAIIALGIIIGAAYAVLKPPLPAGTALVVLPQAAATPSQDAATGAANTIATQIVVATSNAVLTRALGHITPAVSLQTLKGRVQVTNPAGSILAITASGSTDAQAESAANAIATSYVAYASSTSSAAGQVAANLLEPANTATGRALPEQIAIFVVLGGIGGALVGFIVSLVIGRKDRRLVERDAIAQSIAAPVLASIPVGHPSDAASWARLLEEYQPEAVHAWELSKLLQQFGVIGAGSGAAERGSGSSLTVLSLSSDPEALALGPQLAAFAAAQGVPTALVIGPQQDANVTATLRTACNAPAASSAARAKPLSLVVSDEDHLGAPRTAFAVVVTVVDGRSPDLPHAIRTTATVLGVSAGGATAEELARASTAAAADGQEIIGILVANPEPGDQTTGRVPRLATPLRRSLPTRVNGVTMGIRR
jgi:capsular polysaccharide biosynthesis protein